MKKNHLGKLALLIVALPLALTFYMWNIAKENAYRENEANFKALALESENSLLARLDSYSHALLGGAGFFQGSQFVSREEWKKYAETINIKKNFPGIGGIGYIASVLPEKIPQFLKQVREDNSPNFSIHPDTTGKPYNVIVYIEPEESNQLAVGLNIAFEKNREEAAALSRDSGMPAITKKVTLIQDEGKTPGFLLLYPMYSGEKVYTKASERQKALRGWIYAPFIAKDFLHELTKSQGNTLNLRIYDEGKEVSDNLIYSSDDGLSSGHSLFTIRKEVNVMQQKWLIVWESTHNFEEIKKNYGPFFILLGGILFSGLFAILILVIVVRRVETMEWMAGERKIVIPLIIFCITFLGSYYLYEILKEKELGYVENLVDEESSKMSQLIVLGAEGEFLAIKRLAQRWEVAGGTPYAYWQADAKNYVGHMPGLKALEWVDTNFLVRWVEPEKENQNIIGLNILSDPIRKKIVEDGIKKGGSILSPPEKHIQGYNAFILHIPLTVKKMSDGFIVAVFDVKEFLNSMIVSELAGKYFISVSDEKSEFFNSSVSNEFSEEKLHVTKKIKIQEMIWVVKMSPTKRFVESQTTFLPTLVLIAGGLVSFLLALLVRFILIARIKSEKLKNTEAHNRLLVNSVVDYAIYMLDINGNVQSWNTGAQKIKGYTEDEIIGRSFKIFFTKEDIEKGVPEHALHEATVNGRYTTEGFRVRKDGSRFWANVLMQAIYDNTGKLIGFAKVSRDETSRKKVDQMKTEFISTVSHELRTPLTSIRGALGLIAGGAVGVLSEKAASLVQIAISNCERLVRLIGDILDIEKIESGKMEFHLKTADMMEVVRSSISSNEAYASQYNVTLKLLESTKTALSIIDTDRMIQVMTNLISNAVKYSPKNGEVSISVTKENQKIKVEISDQGHGIPDEFKDRIFQKFAQADSSDTRQKGGTGLGLSICKAIVERHGGTIGYDTKEGVGTTFYFEIPLVHHLEETKSEGASNSNRRFLVCEDDPDVAMLIRMMLEHEGFSVDVALDAKTAKKMIGEKKYDGMTLDIMLPDQDGFSLLAELRQTDVGKNLPVIIVSVKELSNEEKNNKINSYHIAEWISKPIDSQKLINAAKHLSEQKSAEKLAVLHVEDDEDVLEVVCEVLSDLATVDTAKNCQEAKNKLLKNKYQLILLDLKLPDGSGLQLLPVIQQQNNNAKVVIFSAADVSVDHTERVAAVLIKGETSNEILKKTISELLGGNKSIEKKIAS